MISLNNLLTSHLGFKINLNYLRINTSTEDLYTEDGFKKLLKIIEKKIKTIKKDPYLAYLYSLYVIKGRWPDGEEAIKKDPELSYYYSLYVIKGRWPEGKKAIKKDPKWAYYYSLYVIKGRWPEGEEAIKKDPHWAYYSKDVIKGRWK
jgi:hypothetical protein